MAMWGWGTAWDEAIASRHFAICPEATLLFEGFCCPRSFTILFRSLNTTRLALRVVLTPLSPMQGFLLVFVGNVSRWQLAISQNLGGRRCPPCAISHLPLHLNLGNDQDARRSLRSLPIFRPATWMAWSLEICTWNFGKRCNPAVPCDA